jgi:hypothetical protein
MRGAATLSEVGRVLGSVPLRTRLGPDPADRIQALAPTPEVAYSVESIFHPVVVTGAGLRTIAVPIRPQFAVELFDYGLSEGRLWGRDRSIALRREHVYFRTPTYQKLLQGPARLLWRVTGDERFGGKSIRGWSLLDEAVTGDVDHLISRFSHLGVLDRGQITQESRGGHVMALRFSHTAVFPRPVALAEYRDVMGVLEPDTGIVNLSPQELTEQVFVRLATMAT